MLFQLSLEEWLTGQTLSKESSGGMAQKQSTWPKGVGTKHGPMRRKGISSKECGLERTLRLTESRNTCSPKPISTEGKPVGKKAVPSDSQLHELPNTVGVGGDYVLIFPRMCAF